MIALVLLLAIGAEPPPGEAYTSSASAPFVRCITPRQWEKMVRAIGNAQKTAGDALIELAKEKGDHALCRDRVDDKDREIANLRMSLTAIPPSSTATVAPVVDVDLGDGSLLGIIVGLISGALIGGSIIQVLHTF